MVLYHGTNKSYAIDIRDGKIDVTLGGGELGRGFYTGDLPHEAFNWAWINHKHNKSVVQLKIDDDDILVQQPLCLNYEETCRYRNRIRSTKKTRTYLFKENIIWGPVVGKNIPNFSQLKFESDRAQKLINSNKTNRIII